ncbi:peptide ABC transporter substrate-binding protein [Wenzhouxiangella sp. XN79A]|uniref:peptide ABC transporter substrate-binding protein n=1 Tax=Wenzhouxiangella sp. XN79A TaxID=2724193 RepID=UPI00144AC6BE|nr:peptide ABC transporter substrate-binding protein [Wenzhouxiangella sp. XN79A]NKI33843.1 peptide ABC transporter substrate-binding protein [Wenzhouxiangella sp. XN79A]
MPVVRRLLLTLALVLLPVAGLPADGPVIHRGLGPSPDTLDIHRAQGLSAFNLLRDLHEGLLTRDPHGRPVPGMASAWSVSEDGRTWRFELDPAARWSDGAPIVAADFVRGVARAREPGTASPTVGWLAPIERVEAPDPATVVFELAHPVPWFEELLTLPVAFPYPPAGRAVSSGAFRLVEQVPGSVFRLERNPYFRAVDSVAPAAVTWHVTEEPSAELARFRAGELHATETVPPGRIDWLREQLGEALRISPYLGSFYLVYNLRQPKFAAPELRQALSLAIDRSLLTERVLGAGELPATRLVPPGLDGWPDETRDRDYRSDVERARALLRRAGHPGGRGLDVELRFNSSLAHRRMAVAVAAMWKQQLGVRTRLVNEEWKVFVTNRRHGRITEIVRGGWIADWADPANFLDNFHSASPLNYAFLSDAELDRLLDAARALRGPARLETLLAAEDRLLDRHAIIPLYYYVSRHLVDPRLSGWEDNVMDIHLSRWLDLED